jgi:putative N6-adenine-specific DNA methylase
MFATCRKPIVITCSKGIPELLEKELQALGFPVLSRSVSSVITEGSLADTMKINLLIRTGHRVLFLLEEFRAEDADDLYREMSRVPWEEYIRPDGYLCVTSTIDNPGIRDSRYANVKGKDAIVDRMREVYGQRPDSGPERSGLVVHLYWNEDKCAVYLDTSGEPLSKRGYRKIPLQAPLQETLAAALVQSTVWDGRGNFINPMCGSGTIAIEAALIGLNRAAGLGRGNYGFMHVRGFDRSVWNVLRAEAAKAGRKSLKGKIIASDMRSEAVSAAKKNAATAGVEHLIEFHVCDFFDTPVPEGNGVVVINPEYGERMGQIEKLGLTYKLMGDFFKQRCGGYTGYVFTGNPHLAKKIGLRTKRRIQFFNGSIECRLLEYDLYEGSRKSKLEK